MPDDAPKFIKESALDRTFNRMMGRLVRIGAGPKYMRLLEVTGRKSGNTFTTPVNLLEFSGKLFVVGARGQTAWARNARAAGEVTLRRGSSITRCIVRELADGEKPEVLKAFLEKFKAQVQRFFTVKAGAPIAEYPAIAPQVPVFELTPKS